MLFNIQPQVCICAYQPFHQSSHICETRATQGVSLKEELYVIEFHVVVTEEIESVLTMLSISIQLSVV
jgi:hypothetical protein